MRLQCCHSQPVNLFPENRPVTGTLIICQKGLIYTLFPKIHGRSKIKQKLNFIDIFWTRSDTCNPAWFPASFRGWFPHVSSLLKALEMLKTLCETKPGRMIICWLCRRADCRMQRSRCSSTPVSHQVITHRWGEDETPIKETQAEGAQPPTCCGSVFLPTF